MKNRTFICSCKNRKEEMGLKILLSLFVIVLDKTKFQNSSGINLMMSGASVHRASYDRV